MAASSGQTPDPSEQGPEPDATHPARYGLEDDPPALPTTSDAGATKALFGLLRRTPFLDLHDRYDKTALKPTPKTRGLCFVLDLLLRLVVYVVIVSIIAAFAWKAIAPIPEPWWDDDDASTEEPRDAANDDEQASVLWRHG